MRRPPCHPCTEQSVRHCVTRDEIYRVADSSGLHYGPAFRLLDRAVVHHGNLIRVELGPAASHTEFVLDPMRLDACCHGLLTVFPELQAEERGVSYLPVRLDRAALFTPGGIPHSAIIEVLNKNERSIVANYYFLGARGELLATLSGVRCQAVQVRRSSTLEANTFVELPQLVGGAILGTGGLAAGATAVVAQARALGVLSGASGSSVQGELLVEGWATAAAHEIVSALADGLVVDTDALVSSGQLPVELRPWFVSLLINLEAAGLAKEEDGQLVLIRDPLLPSAASVVKDLVREHPARAAEALIAGRFTGFAEQVSSERAIVGTGETILSTSVLDFYDVASVSLRDASELIARLIAHDAFWPRDRAVQILQIGFGPLTQSLLALQGPRDVLVTVFEPDRRRFDLAQRALAKTGDFVLVDAEHADDLGQFDLVLAAESLHRLPQNFDLARLRDALVPGGLLIAVEPRPSLFRDIAFGLDPSWFGAVAQDFPVQRLRQTDAWPVVLESAGFEKAEAQTVAGGSGLASLIVAEAGHVSLPQQQSHGLESRTKPNPCVLIFDPPRGLPFNVGAMLVECFGEQGIAATAVHTLDFSDPAPDTLIHLLTPGDAQGDPMEQLAARCLEIKACAERFGSARATLWLVFGGALASNSSKVRPVATGAWAFSRTLANEFPNLDVRRVDIVPHVPARTAAARLRDIIVSAHEGNRTPDRRYDHPRRARRYDQAPSEQLTLSKCFCGKT